MWSSEQKPVICQGTSVLIRRWSWILWACDVEGNESGFCLVGSFGIINVESWGSLPQHWLNISVFVDNDFIDTTDWYITLYVIHKYWSDTIIYTLMSQIVKMDQ